MSTASPIAIYEQMIQKDNFSQWLGIELMQISVGYCQLQMIVRPEMLNGFGILHGGVSFAFADSAFAFASNSHGRLSVSQQASMTYAKPAKEGDVLIAEATQLNLGHKTATFDVKVYQKTSEVVIGFFRGSVYRTAKEMGPY